MIRKDNHDVIYKNEDAKFRAVIEDIKESHKKGQPVLVGTVSVEKSEKLSSILRKEGIKHEVLNAKYHEKEAAIVAQAGKYGAVTISTNMAGRGTDIMLGGNSEFLAKEEMRRQKYSEEMIEAANSFYETDDESILKARKVYKELIEKFDKEIEEERQKVIDAGGLKIIGTERHESRRIDNQLRGRSGRQGDIGGSRFYIGLDDDLMKIFGGDMITRVYNTLGADENMPIQAKILSKTVENAQKKVEGKNFSIRKNVLQYDDVMNQQRELIYAQRREVLDGKDLKESILKMVNGVAEDLVSMYTNVLEGEDIDLQGLKLQIKEIFGLEDIKALKAEELDEEALVSELQEKALAKYEEKEQEVGETEFRELERIVMLKVVDEKWMDHIDAMDELKDGIGLRAYGQKDPVVQYRIEGSDMFDAMIADIRTDVVKILLNVHKSNNMRRKETVEITNASLENINGIDGETTNHEPIRNEGPKVGRNDPCPCGSGKKYKNCHGKNQ